MLSVLRKKQNQSISEMESSRTVAYSTPRTPRGQKSLALASKRPSGLGLVGVVLNISPPVISSNSLMAMFHVQLKYYARVVDIVGMFQPRRVCIHTVQR